MVGVGLRRLTSCWALRGTGALKASKSATLPADPFGLMSPSTRRICSLTPILARALRRLSARALIAAKATFSRTSFSVMRCGRSSAMALKRRSAVWGSAPSAVTTIGRKVARPSASTFSLYIVFLAFVLSSTMKRPDSAGSRARVAGVRTLAVME